MTDLIFQSSPKVHFATNTFINVPTILQYNDVPLISVVRAEPAGFTSVIRVYHEDGTYLAKVVGSQLHPTPEGRKAGVTVRHPPLMTICELGGRTVCELRREGPAALKTAAELYTPDGVFLKSMNAQLTATATDNKPLTILGMSFSECTFDGNPVGIHVVQADGRLTVGVGGFVTGPQRRG